MQKTARRRVASQSSGLDFTSNDFLGLARSQHLRSAVMRALESGSAVGSAGSRLLRGTHPAHEALEEDAAGYFGSDSMLYFGSGYAANLGALSCLPRSRDLIVYDQLVHASARDGIRLGRAASVPAAHNDADSVEGRICEWRRTGGMGTPWIVVESLYSMDGDCAPLDALIEIADRHQGILYVDEAHATGVYGLGGRGFAAHLAGRDNVLVLHGCGKALGTTGALLGSNRVLRDTLINQARPFIYSTAPSPLQATCVREALAILAKEPDRRENLQALIRHAHDCFLRHFGTRGTGTQILPMILGSSENALRVASQLAENGYDLRAIRPPTVPAGSARLRISITLNVNQDQIAGLFDCLAGVMADERA